MKPTRAALERRLKTLESRALPEEVPEFILTLNNQDGTQTVLVLGDAYRTPKPDKT